MSDSNTLKIDTAWTPTGRGWALAVTSKAYPTKARVAGKVVVLTWSAPKGQERDAKADVDTLALCMRNDGATDVLVVERLL